VRPRKGAQRAAGNNACDTSASATGAARAISVTLRTIPTRPCWASSMRWAFLGSRGIIRGISKKKKKKKKKNTAVRAKKNRGRPAQPTAIRSGYRTPRSPPSATGHWRPSLGRPQCTPDSWSSSSWPSWRWSYASRAGDVLARCAVAAFGSLHRAREDDAQ